MGRALTPDEVTLVEALSEGGAMPLDQLIVELVSSDVFLDAEGDF